MTHTRLLISAGIIALVIGLGFMLSVPHTTRDVVQKSAAETTPVVPVVTVRDTYKKGVHTITGSLQAPNACSTVTAQAALAGDASSTESIQLSLTMPTDTSVCLQLPTSAKFVATVTAPAKLPITVTVNGNVASTTSL